MKIEIHEAQTPQPVADRASAYVLSFLLGCMTGGAAAMLYEHPPVIAPVAPLAGPIPPFAADVAPPPVPPRDAP